MRIIDPKLDQLIKDQKSDELIKILICWSLDPRAEEDATYVDGTQMQLRCNLDEN